jgi:hypothetical protein
MIAGVGDLGPSVEDHHAIPDILEAVRSEHRIDGTRPTPIVCHADYRFIKASALEEKTSR